MMPLCREQGIGIMPYSPLAIGLLTGHYRRGQEPPVGTVWSKAEGRGLSAHKYNFEEAMTERVDGIVQALVDIGQAHDKTPAQVALAWLLDHPEVTAPIVGADLPEHVDDAFGAADWRLNREDRVRLDKVSTLEGPKKYAYGTALLTMHPILHPPPASRSREKTLPDVRYAGRCPQTGCERALRPTHEALWAAQELMDHLSNHRTPSDKFSTASLYEEANGKMFGVLVCRQRTDSAACCAPFPASGKDERRRPAGCLPAAFRPNTKRSATGRKPRWPTSRSASHPLKKSCPARAHCGERLKSSR